jgi:hypothetical protein
MGVDRLRRQPKNRIALYAVERGHLTLGGVERVSCSVSEATPLNTAESEAGIGAT